MKKDSVTITPNSTIHFIGIGGIGMSGLAQMFLALGCQVTGSDRAVDAPENSAIFTPLKKQGIKLFPQDGSVTKHYTPDYIIYSTAIETDNPDFIALQNTTRLHRSEALNIAINQMSGKATIAVTGSAGKTTVSSWLAETLFLQEKNCKFITGGLVKRFISEKNTGNFFNGVTHKSSPYFIFEADESDKSLTAYHPDYAILLNIGTDHYSKEELINVFAQFLKNVKHGAIIEVNAFNMLPKSCYNHLKIITFGENEIKNPDVYVSDYHIKNRIISTQLNKTTNIKLPAPGLHTALNCAAIIATLKLLNIYSETSLSCLSQFQGVWRRFEYAGKNSRGVNIYDDYGHNVEKIAAGIRTAKEVTRNKLFIIFQPHGFGPLNFMKDELFSMLENELTDSECFIMLPVYYAGGTTSFKPTSHEVIAEYTANGNKTYQSFENREKTEYFLNKMAHSGDTVIIMGARDNSLSTWAYHLSTT
jgi:UDP-N-acetylmuramate--alanine ligase